MKRNRVISIIIVAIAIAATGIFAFAQSSVTDTAQKAILASSDAHYEALGIERGNVAIWEDGMRTDGKEGSYEWWYTDAEFEDGSTIVVVFYTKDGFDVTGSARPRANFQLTYPDGTVISRDVYEEGTVLNAATNVADVQVQDSYLRYVDGDYELYFVDGDLEYDVVMKSLLPMHRPETGHQYFGDNEEYYFAWLAAQPKSEIRGTLTLAGETTEIVGRGYHDHNWGNVAMNEVMNHWYWGRVQIGDYTLITSDVVAEEAYGYTPVSQFYIAKGEEVIEYDPSQLQVERGDTIQHPETGKFMDNHLTYIVTDENGIQYTLEYFRENDIVVHSLLDDLEPLQREVARAMGANPTYIRVLGTVKLTIHDGEDEQVLEGEGLWEQMFFGSNTEAIIGSR